MKSMPYCPNCNEQIDNGKIFCPDCGTKLPLKNSISKAQEITVYILSFLLVPFGLYWFFKYKKENDPQKNLIANRILWITVATIVFILISAIFAANYYRQLINDLSSGYGF